MDETRDDADVRVAVAERAARRGAAVAADRFRSDLDVETKDGKTDVVTETDREVQRRVVEIIRSTFPDDPIVGEENDRRSAVPDDGPAWVIDPIDGTNNYVRGIGPWATSVAATVDGDPVAAANVVPPADDAYVVGPDGVWQNGREITISDRSDPERCAVVPTFWWDFDRRDEYGRAATATVQRFGDLRRPGCAQATLSMIAAGGIDGAFTNRRPNPWDVVGGVRMIRSAGGTVTDLTGDPWRHDAGGLVASNGEVHDAVLTAARRIDGE